MSPPRAFVPFPRDLQPVRLVRRRNRFVVEVRWDAEARKSGVPAVGSVGEFQDGGKHARTVGTEPEAPDLPTESRDLLSLHLPNSGRMMELLQPGTLGLAQIDTREGRGTAGTLLLVQYEGRWVSVDARMPNRLFARCLEAGGLSPFQGYTTWKAEVSWGQSRVDFLLSRRHMPNPEQPLPVNGSKNPSNKPSFFLVETKSCNLVVDGLALFPDAPTTRGTRHLRELAEAVAMGYRAAVVWFVQRDDAKALAAHGEADPDFARALADARARGVEAYAYRCLVEPSGITVLDEVPVEG